MTTNLEPVSTSHLFPQLGDVSYVVAAVPRIQRQIFLKGHDSQFGMAEGALPFLGLDQTQRADEAIMQRVEQSERNFQRGGLGVR
jgi:hypothetical protein